MKSRRSSCCYLQKGQQAPEATAAEAALALAAKVTSTAATIIESFVFIHHLCFERSIPLVCQDTG